MASLCMLFPFPHPVKGDGTQVGLPYWSSTSVSFFPLDRKAGWDKAGDKEEDLPTKKPKGTLFPSSSVP